MEFLLLGLKGLVIGAANIMPGVSGATFAVIFRVYDRLIEAINLLFKDTKKSLRFLIPLGLGMAIGVLALGSAFSFFYERFPLQTVVLIAGMIAGSAPYIHNQAKVGMDSDKQVRYYAIAIIAAIVIILLALLTPTPERYTEEAFSFGYAVFLFIGGAFAAAAMVVPGVSGAMVLILFGLLPTVMNTISLITQYLRTPFTFELLPPIIMVVAPIGLGMVLGILLCSRLIAVLLKKFHNATYFAILGMVFGAIFVMFYDTDTSQDIGVMTVVIAISMFVVGLVVALRLGKKEEANNEVSTS